MGHENELGMGLGMGSCVVGKIGIDSYSESDSDLLSSSDSGSAVADNGLVLESCVATAVADNGFGLETRDAGRIRMDSESDSDVDSDDCKCNCGGNCKTGGKDGTLVERLVLDVRGRN